MTVRPLQLLWATIAIVVVAVLLLRGGGSGTPATASAALADAMHQAATGDPSRACSYLTPDISAQLVADHESTLSPPPTGLSCTQVVVMLRNEGGDRVYSRATTSVQQTGDTATATVTAPSVATFQVTMARIAGAWKVTAYSPRETQLSAIGQ